MGTTGCMHTRQSSHEIVGYYIDKGGHRYQPLHHFILREVLARRCVMFMLRVMIYTLFLIICFEIELVLCDFKLYLTGFSLKKSLLCDIFFLLTNCVAVIPEYLNSNNFQYQWNCKSSKTLKSIFCHLGVFITCSPQQDEIK